MTSTLVRLSRLPVGSSARIRLGVLTSARAMATRCCWPPDSSLGGGGRGRPGRPLRARPSPARWRSPAGTPAYSIGSITLPRRPSAGSRLKPWKMKPILRLRRSASALRLSVGDLDAVQHVRAGGGAVQAADQVHEGGLAGAGRPHHHHELARPDLERDAAQGRHHGVAHVVLLAEIRDLDDRRALGTDIARRRRTVEPSPRGPSPFVTVAPVLSTLTDSSGLPTCKPWRRVLHRPGPIGCFLVSYRFTLSRHHRAWPRRRPGASAVGHRRRAVRPGPRRGSSRRLSSCWSSGPRR